MAGFRRCRRAIQLMMAAAGLVACSIDEQRVNSALATKISAIEAITEQVDGADFDSIKAYRRAPLSARREAAPLRVIIVPGAPSDVVFWGGAMERIEPEAEVIGVERPGYRGSGPRRAVTDITDQAGTLAKLIRGYDGPIVLVGHSYGASVVLAAMAMYGDAIDGAVLVSPYVFPAHGGRRTWFQLLRFSPMRFIGGAMTRRFIQEVAAQRKQSPALLEIAETTCTPVLIVEGDRDDLVPPKDAEALAKKFQPCAGAEIKYVKGGDHYLSVHNAAEIADLVNGFTARLVDSGRG